MWEKQLFENQIFFMAGSKEKNILTKNNLVKRDWKSCIKMCFFFFCNETELANHLFVNYVIIKILWSLIDSYQMRCKLPLICVEK